MGKRKKKEDADECDESSDERGDFDIPSADSPVLTDRVCAELGCPRYSRRAYPCVHWARAYMIPIWGLLFFASLLGHPAHLSYNNWDYSELEFFAALRGRRDLDGIDEDDLPDGPWYFNPDAVPGFQVHDSGYLYTNKATLEDPVHGSSVMHYYQNLRFHKVMAQLRFVLRLKKAGHSSEYIAQERKAADTLHVSHKDWAHPGYKLQVNPLRYAIEERQTNTDRDGQWRGWFNIAALGKFAGTLTRNANATVDPKLFTQPGLAALKGHKDAGGKTFVVREMSLKEKEEMDVTCFAPIEPWCPGDPPVCKRFPGEASTVSCATVAATDQSQGQVSTQADLRSARTWYTWTQMEPFHPHASGTEGPPLLYDPKFGDLKPRLIQDWLHKWAPKVKGKDIFRKESTLVVDA